MNRIQSPQKNSWLITLAQAAFFFLRAFSLGPKIHTGRRPKGPPKAGGILITCMMACLLTACATGPAFIEEPSAPRPDFAISATDGNLSAALNYLIIANGPGSWVENAPWDEYVLTLKNLTGDPLTIEKVSLIDPRGAYFESESDPVQAGQKTSDLAQQYEELGMSIAVGQAASAAGIGGIFGPISSIFGITRDHYEQKEHAEIRNEFNRRRFNIIRLQGQKSITNSAFFPVIPNPQALIINYRKGNNPETIEMSLEKLKGLHTGG